MAVGSQTAHGHHTCYAKLQLLLYTHLLQMDLLIAQLDFHHTQDVFMQHHPGLADNLFTHEQSYGDFITQLTTGCGFADCLTVNSAGA